MEKLRDKNFSRRRFLGFTALGMTGLTVLPAWGMDNNMHVSSPNGDFYKIRNGVPNSQYFIKENIAGNQYIFFIGNSVLSGAGLKDSSLRYSAQFIKAIKKYYPDANIPENRHMQPGGSWFAQFRCSHGQPVFGEVIFSGHLAILDFAADDRNVPIEQVKSTLEAVIRQIILFRDTHSRILIYTLTPEMLQSYISGRIPEYIKLSEKIADHYGIPSLNLAKYAADKIKNGEISAEAFSADGINPTDAGARIYAEAIVKFTDALMSAYPVPEKPANFVLPKPMFRETNDKGRIIAYEDPQVKRYGDWKPGQKSPIPPFRHVLVSNQPEAMLALKFRGSEIGILDVVDKDSADYEYSIDKGAFHKLKAGKDLMGPVMRPISLAKGLDLKQEHELVIKVSSAGVARLGGFLLNGSIENAFAGMSTLEQIDAIYATMDPVVYNPPAGRFSNIPKTMNKLRNGKDLQMVLLGDSIMNNTYSSSFELLLMRNYPECKINKIPSFRSGTGCTYYKEENRVEQYVLRHNPELLVIGGISNGEAESIRTVIKQVRARKPDTEIMLLTPVFGANKDEIINKITYEIDTTSENYRYQLQKIAAEEKCAFFDMTGPLWEYIRNSGKTPGWFMGDSTHANSRGCQIIGRLLEAWFKD